MASTAWAWLFGGGLLVAGGLGAAFFLVLWRLLARIDAKLETLSHGCREQRLALERQFVHRLPHEEEHRDLWRAVNFHCGRPRSRR